MQDNLEKGLPLSSFHPELQKSFIDYDLEKGTYKDNTANRKAGIVGQQYGGSSEKESDNIMDKWRSLSVSKQKKILKENGIRPSDYNKVTDKQIESFLKN